MQYSQLAKLSNAIILLTSTTLLANSASFAIQEADKHPAPEEPNVADASDDAALAMSSIKHPEELQAKLFAAEPLVANPVAIDVDVHGRVFVCETYRQEAGVEDNRDHPEWLNDDLAAMTVEDRIQYIREHEANIDEGYRRQGDRLRLLWDSDKDGIADESKVFSTDYNRIEEGTGAGVLAVGNDVFYTNIPHLWKLKDNDSDGVADEKISVHSGFGVRFAFRGHDLHGLIVGPDRRLYFTIGDRGYHVNEEISDPTSGAVFSCELDGGDLQVIATGLRNPQELAFDDYGNLFTGDNNSDSGDKARWVYVVPGGDSGWRMYYQYVPDRGPFNREKIWHPYNPDTPAFIVPPIANISDGPSGIAFYPGTGLTEHFRDRFLLCDFRGTQSVSGIRTFRLKPRGAGFEIVDSEQTIWHTLATDAAFGSDGKLYVADWVFGWVGVGKGRIFTFESKSKADEPLLRQVQVILQEGLQEATDSELLSLLSHADRRVRYAAQFELVDRNKTDVLLNAFLDVEATVLKAIHGIWGFTQLAKKFGLNQLLSAEDQVALKLNLFECENRDEEIRAQIAKMIGEAKKLNLSIALDIFAKDPSPRVRYMAGIAIGKVGDDRHLKSLMQMLIENNNEDPFLRHAGIMGLTGVLGRMDVKQRAATMALLSKHDSSSVRIATVVALRKLKDPFVVEFLGDANATIVLEAARAIHDLPLGTIAMNGLAELIARPQQEDALTRRVINANLILGTQESADALVRFALNQAATEDRRQDAIRLLHQWSNPKSIDYVLGDWRPLEERDGSIAQAALEKGMASALDDHAIVETYVAACVANQVVLPTDKLIEFVEHSKSAKLQTAALLAIKEQDEEKFVGLLTQKLRSSEKIPTDWFPLLTAMDAENVKTFVIGVLSGDAKTPRKQQAIALLGEMASHAPMTPSMLALLKDIESNSIDKKLKLDVLLAAQKFESPQVRTALQRYQNAQTDIQIPYEFALHGGNSSQGKKVFFERTELSCLRCHTVGASGGNVGPELSGIGLVKNREYILEAIVDPNKTIADGFNELIVLTDEGTMVTGIKKAEDEDSITLLDKDGLSIRVAKETIEDEKIGQSSMPEDLIKKISMRELRDLVEYLAQQKSTSKTERKPAGH